MASIAVWEDEKSREYYQDCGDESEEFIFGFLANQPVLMNSIKVYRDGRRYILKGELVEG